VPHTDHAIPSGIFQICKEENPTSAVQGSQKVVTSSGKLSCRKFPKQPYCPFRIRRTASGHRTSAVGGVYPRSIFYRPLRRSDPRLPFPFFGFQKPNNNNRWCPTFSEYFALSTSNPSKGAVIHVHNTSYINAQPTIFTLAPRPLQVRDFDFLATPGIPRIAAGVGNEAVIFYIGVES